MNTAKNSTKSAAGATDLMCAAPVAVIDHIVDSLEAKDGLISKAVAAKHLTAIALDEFERQFRQDRGQDDKGIWTYRLPSSSIDQLRWLLCQAYEISADCAALADALESELTPVANAAYEARKAVHHDAA